MAKTGPWRRTTVLGWLSAVSVVGHERGVVKQACQVLGKCMTTLVSCLVVGLSALMAVSCVKASTARVVSTEMEATGYPGPIIDPHIHVFFDEKVAKSVHPINVATPEKLRALVTASGVTPGFMVMATGSESAVRQQNDRLLAFVKQVPGAFAIGSVNPHHGEAALEELERMVAAGVRWLKLHPNTQRFDVSDPRVAQIVARAGKLGIPVTFDASALLDADQIGKFITLAMMNPQTDIVLAHMGGARFDELSMLKALEMYPWWKRNLWMDISFTLPHFVDSPRRETLLWTLRTIGIDRVLFASDYPAHTPRETRDAVLRAGFSAEELRRVFVLNTQELLDKEARRRKARTLGDG